MNSIFAEDLKLYFLKITTEKFEELVKLQKAYKVEIGECMPTNEEWF